MSSTPNIVIYSAFGGFHGGVERFLHQAAQALREADVTCHGVFDTPARQPDEFARPFASVSFGESALSSLCTTADWLWLHKCPDCTTVARLPRRPPLAYYVHDHDYYCFRRYKYFPFRRINCPLPSHLYCLPCGKMAANPGNWRLFQKNLKLIRQADIIMTVATHMLRNLTSNGFPKEKLRLLPPLIDVMPTLTATNTQNLAAKPTSAKEILFVGQIIRGKGVDLLLRAVSQLTCDWHLTVLGDGNDRQYCQEIAQSLGLTDKVSFSGFVSDPSPYYQRATVLAFPSRWQEPFGLTGPEAMANGVPVVGFNVGGVSEWLKNGHNGILVPPANTTKMAEALQTLLTNASLAKKLGQQGAKDMAKYSKTSFARQLLDIFANYKPANG